MTPSSSRPPRPSPKFCWAIFGLLVVHAWIALEASTHKSTTNDEIAHLTGGYTFNTLGDFRIQPENGVLPQRWHALPLSWTRPTLPELAAAPWTQGLAYQFSYDFFYQSGNDPDALLFTGRAMNVAWGLATLLLVAGTTFRCFGPGAALFATAMGALSPTFLAHSAIATSDMAMTFFFVATVLAFWWHLNRPGLITFAVSSLTFGLACVAKFSAVLLLPMMALMITVRCVSGPAVPHPWRGPDNPVRRAVNLAGWWGGHGVVAVAVIWLFFGFRFSMMAPGVPPGTMPLAWAHVLSAHPGWEPLIFTLRDLRVLPEAFLYGFSYVLAFSLARGAFLDGQLSTTGWVEFFPKTFLYKTPLFELISLLAVVGVLIWWLRQRPRDLGSRLYSWVPGITLLVVYWVFSLTSHLNIGHRHILPTYPWLLIATGSVIWALGKSSLPLLRGRFAPAVVGGALGLGQVLSMVSVHPHHLAYFNALSGGSTRGYQHLADSSLDWGQDLPGLAKWLEQRDATEPPIYLAYFGTGEPAHYGIEPTWITRLPSFDQPTGWPTLQAGTYAISATLLQHVYRQQHQPWSAESETTYQTLRNLEPSFRTMAGHPEHHPDLRDGATAAEWHHAWNLYNELRFARLCEYLRVRPPDAMIGYSILIFELDQAEIDAALYAQLPALVQLIQTAATRPFNPVVP